MAEFSKRSKCSETACSVRRTWRVVGNSHVLICGKWKPGMRLGKAACYWAAYDCPHGNTLYWGISRTQAVRAIERDISRRFPTAKKPQSRSREVRSKAKRRLTRHGSAVKKN